MCCHYLLLFQTQDTFYKEYSDAYQWGLIYGAVGVSEIALNVLERALNAASSACDGAGKHTVAHINCGMVVQLSP